jgi:ribosomal protein L21
MKKASIALATALTISLISPVYADDSPEKSHTEETCPAPIIKTVYVDVPGPTVYVDKPVPGPTVYITKSVPGPTVYVDKPVVETKTVVETQTVTVAGPTQTITVENPINTDLQVQLAKLKAKYAKLLKSYKINRKHEVTEKARGK